MQVYILVAALGDYNEMISRSYCISPNWAVHEWRSLACNPEKCAVCIFTLDVMANYTRQAVDGKKLTMMVLIESSAPPHCFELVPIPPDLSWKFVSDTQRYWVKLINEV